MRLNFMSLLVVLLMCISAVAQTHQVLSMSITNIPVDDTTTANGQIDISDSTVFNTVMIISVADTTDIAKFHVVLKESAQFSPAYQGTFTYDVFGSLGNHMFYNRSYYDISLGLGNHMGLTQVYAELILEKSDGTLLPAVIFSN